MTVARWRHLAARWRYPIAGGAALLIGAALAAAWALASIGPRLRAEVERTLAERLDSVVTLESLEVRLLPRPALLGRGLTVRYQGRTDIPPLVSVGSFEGHATWWGALAGRLREARVDGLAVTIPPNRREEMPDLPAPDAPASAGFEIARLISTNARLSILPRESGKEPRVFDIAALEVRDLTFVTPSTFVASLTNPVPAGRIETEGSFGPWSRAEPGDTPLDGRFTFAADLGTIKGIAGALESSGRFDGTVNRVVATGTTHTPDFSVPRLKAAALVLDTTFRAVVDGTNGDVQLESVDARLAGSRFLAKGFIVGTRGIKGKRVLLDVSSEEARMEDLLRLTVRATPPPMSGAVRLTSSFDLPQGDRDVIDKLLMGGTVTITGARFASDAVQDKVDDLSRRARGRPDDATIDDVASAITAGFTLEDGVVTLRDVAYTVRGAAVALAGTYVLDGGALDFHGTARLRATVSQTQTGIRHFLLKPFDALFRKGGAGTRLAIKVTGTVDDPQFGLEIGRTLTGR